MGIESKCGVRVHIEIDSQFLFIMIIDCKSLSDKLREEMKEEVSHLDTKPCLAVIKVGDNPASEVYVRNKQKACEYVGYVVVS